MDLDELRDELSDFAQPEKQSARSPREERLIAGFEEIQRFVEQHNRLPQQGEACDIFERLYAVRLQRLRELAECRALLQQLDHQGLLGDAQFQSDATEDSLSDDELLNELEGLGGDSSITSLKHVRSVSEIKAAEEIANREKCEDFEQFEPLFDQVEQELKSGLRRSLPFGNYMGMGVTINEGDFFILSGQLAYIAEVGEPIKAPNGENDARLRVIFSNRTQSNLLKRSLQRALYKDEGGRRISEPDAGPLFSGEWDEGDVESGTIYVLRSKSDHPFVAEHRNLIHKIGVTGGKVENRIANAAHDSTYLLADVEVVATYKLAGINRTKLEGLFHKVFASAQLDLTIQDRFGNPVKPREWFLVPLPVIDEAVQAIMDGSITALHYEPKEARLIYRGDVS
jgi:hypothetical protein